MKVSSVAILAAVSMIFTSFSVWSLTGKPRGEPAIAPVGSVQPLSGGKTPSFTRAGTLELEGRLGHAWLPAGAPTETFLLATVKAPADGVDREGRSPGATPVNLSIVIDRSGSMKGKRLSNALDAARGMLRRVRDGDVVSIIAYDTRTETLVPPTTIDDSARQRIAAALGGIRASGDTCISCGIDAAMATLRSRSDMLQRILLLSDGEPTAGVRDIEGFRRIAAVARGMNCSDQLDRRRRRLQRALAERAGPGFEWQPLLRRKRGGARARLRKRAPLARTHGWPARGARASAVRGCRARQGLRSHVPARRP